MSIKIETRLINFDIPINPKPGVRKKMLRVLANKVIELIKTRVNNGWALSAGESRSGATTTFIGYSEGYKKYKKSIGRTPESVGDWLRLTGMMLTSLGVLEVSPDHWVVGFSGERPDTRPRSIAARKTIQKKLRGMSGRWKEAYRERLRAKAYKGSYLKEQKPPKMVSNAMLAYVNDQLRPFVGLTEKEKTEAIDHMMQHAISKGWI